MNAPENHAAVQPQEIADALNKLFDYKDQTSTASKSAAQQILLMAYCTQKDTLVDWADSVRENPSSSQQEKKLVDKFSELCKFEIGKDGASKLNAAESIMHLRYLSIKSELSEWAKSTLDSQATSWQNCPSIGATKGR